MEQSESAPTSRAAHSRLAWPVLLAMVVLVDTLIYRSRGFAGIAAFFPVAIVLLLLGRNHVRWNSALLLVTSLAILVSASMVWAGSVGQVAIAFWLMVAVNMAAQGLTPYVLESIVALAGVVPGGYEFLHAVQLNWRRIVLDPVDHSRPSRTLNFLLPMVSVVVFGTVFILANPDVIKQLSSLLSEFILQLQEWVSNFSAPEVIIWCVTIWITGGLLSPVVRRAVSAAEITIRQPVAGFEHPMYGPFRNTLATLISLFVVYLIFEFCTLWFRTFPEGFHYSGYAHEGAAWLTVALALTTLTLSLIFRGSMTDDPRVETLKNLAWVWSALNFLLVASVYNRLLIYVDFNGMTRMRVVGFLGISAVVGGFVFVLWKIIQRQRFIWLIRRQLWMLGIAIYLYLVVPVDLLVHRYNVQRILSGSPAPCVQISEHPITDDALPQLLPLLQCENQTIREGIQALLWTRLAILKSNSETDSQDWTATQFGRRHAHEELLSAEQTLLPMGKDDNATTALQSFHDYAMQWW